MAIDDRPRKKKKQKSNKGLWIGLGIGGGVLVILVVALVVVLAVSAMNNREPDDQAKAKLQALLAAQKPAPPPPPVQPPPQFKDIGEKKRATDSIRARADRPDRLNELKQIGLFYQQYILNFNRPPTTVQDFTEFIKRDSAGIKKAIDEKYYFLVVQVKGQSGIVAYEFDPDTRSRHGIAEMGGRADDMTTQELLAALKAQGSQ